MKRRLFTTMTTVLFACSALQVAQAQIPRVFQPAGPADWYDTANWSDNLAPSRAFSEFGQINMSRYAYVDTPRANTVFDGFDANPGGVELSVQGSIGSGSILEIRNGGTFRVAFDAGAGDLTTGGVLVGSPNGTGLLRVLPGGEMTIDGNLGVSFTAAPNPPSSVTVGSINVAETTPAVLNAGSGSVDGILQVFGNGSVGFNDFLTFVGNATFRPDVRASGNATVQVANTASLGGNIIVDFTDYTPTPGESWTLIDAGTISGNFASVSSPAVGLGETLIPSIGSAGGRQQYNVTYSTNLVLTVDRDTGAVAITNPNAPGIMSDAYSIRSGSGRLNPSAWNSLDAGGLLGGDWRESNPTANALTELKQTGLGTFGGSSTIALGNIYNPLAGPFLSGDDLVFDYATADGTVIPGQIVYTGTRVNNLVLQVDPNTGETRLRNTSNTVVSIDGYDVASGSGSLATGTWDPLGGDWRATSSSDAFRISELNPDSALTLAPNDEVALGNLFAGGTQDFVFNFLQVGNSFPTTGVVFFQPFAGAGLNADFNNDGFVDGDDLEIWENAFGATPAGDADGDGISDGHDFLIWQRQFGTSAPLAGGLGAAQAVPEPSSLLLGLVLLAGPFPGCRRRSGPC